MEIVKFIEDVEVIQKLSTFPNAEDGLTAEELKAKFDEASVKIKTYLNDSLVPAMEDLLGKAFPITLTGDATQGYSADCTAEEIKTAYSEEKTILCVIPLDESTVRVPLLSVVEDEGRMTFVFGGTAAGLNFSDVVSNVTVSIFADQELHITVSIESLSGGGGSEGCGCEEFVVEVSGQYGDELTSSHTYSQIFAAYYAGMKCVCHWDYRGGDHVDGTYVILPLVRVENTEWPSSPYGVVHFGGVFHGYNGPIAITLSIANKGAVTGIVRAIGVDSSPYIVTMTDNGDGVYTSDKTYAEVLAVHEAGVRPIQCRITIDEVNYVLPLCGTVDGMLVYGGSAGVMSAMVTQTEASVEAHTATLATAEDIDAINTLIGGEG